MFLWKYIKSRFKSQNKSMKQHNKNACLVSTLAVPVCKQMHVLNPSLGNSLKFIRREQKIIKYISLIGKKFLINN